MPVEWKDESVTDHSGGITDLVTASGSEFQELCNNLGVNMKLQVLSTRDGYRRYAVAAPAPISQLFKLEDWLIAFCTDGQLHYRLESNTVSPWVQVETPKARTATLFRIHNSAGKGFTFRVASGTIFDQFYVKGENLGAGFPTPTLGSSGRSLQFEINTHFVTSDLKYNPGSGNLTFTQLLTHFSGYTPTLLSGTLGTDQVVFDGLLAIQENPSPLLQIYPATVRADGDGAASVFAGEEGHLQPSEWQSHLFMALEPYLKTTAANPSDPLGEDPEAFPPVNQRLPLRKIVPFAPAIGSGSTATALKAVNAQLPQSLIGVTSDETKENTYTDANQAYRYQVFRLRWLYTSTAYAADDPAEIEIWCERTWGQQGLAGTMPTGCYLLTRHNTAANPINGGLYSLQDYALRSLTPWATGSLIWPSSGGTALWGYMALHFHSNTGVNKTFQQVVDGITAAFTEYQNRYYTTGGTTYRGSYRNFGFYVKVNPKSRMTATVDASVPLAVNYRYADNLPESVAGNHRYGYAFYLRDSYKAMVEGSPRDFLTDGPASFLSVRTLSPIGNEVLKGYSDAALTDVYSYTAGPWILGGISKAIEGGLYLQSGMEAIFARTLDGGDTYYIDQPLKTWWRTTDPLPGFIGASVVPTGLLTGEDWTNRTSYIVVHQSVTSDDALQYKEQAYFNGGVLSYDGIPQGPFYFDIVNQMGVYANIVGNIHRAYLSPPGAPYASPATIFEDFDDEITGVTHYLDKPIVTTAIKLWRIEGTKGSDGSGRFFLRTVSDEYGCIANQSIVRTNLGLFLWSKSGIVWTDGLRALRVTEHLIGRYAGWLTAMTGGERVIGPEKLRGAYDALNRKVYWSAVDSVGKPFFVVLSLQKGISDSMPIVTEDGVRFQSVDSVGDITNTDYFETHATLYSEDRQAWYRAQGTFVMVRDETRTYDESHVTGLKHPIVPYFKSVAYAYGIPWARKQTSKIQLNLRDLTKKGVSLTPLGWNDLSETPHSLVSCLSYQHMDFSLNYATATKLDLEQFWKHSDCKWKSDMLVTYKRGFGRGKQRNCFKQIGFTALKLRYGEITKDTPGVTSIQLVHKAKDVPGPGDFPEATVYIQITATGTAVTSLSLDASGQFYVAWNDTMEPVAICDYSAASPNYTIKVLPGGANLTNAADYVESWPELRFYRVFTDQRIDLLGYALTYRLIGDRTHGSLKSPEHGGVDA